MSVNDHSPSELLSRLDATENLSILRIRDSIFEDSTSSPNKRNSDISTTEDGYENATPASLEADLAHYRDLFSKLRFSYIEQVTKEKFLRAITFSTPLFIDPADNALLEQQLAEQKAALQQQKADVATQIKQLEDKAKQLVARYDALHAQREELETLPTQVAQLEEEVKLLRESEASESRDVHDAAKEPHLSLPLEETRELLVRKEAEIDALDMELETLRRQVPQAGSELEKLGKELRPLEAQKMGAVTAAREARKRREGGGMDELEGKGRWWGACGRGLESWLQLEG
ncbi:hypothetical protein NA57DRAFT_71087 [Rhizodiscina lignyota]|uniref:Kinetochore protein Sos7 coiled-coil domain-containing protein n=1 Tax=Rhizodiscina lignyota TaxID=1504668 RepID=A0A9P4INR8_9PEZI|nr:hypothetical protein NA57DRAFT_71087 [Rhizodiscina lignyota]